MERVMEQLAVSNDPFLLAELELGAARGSAGGPLLPGRLAVLAAQFAALQGDVDVGPWDRCAILVDPGPDPTPDPESPDESATA